MPDLLPSPGLICWTLLLSDADLRWNYLVYRIQAKAHSLPCWRVKIAKQNKSSSLSFETSLPLFLRIRISLYGLRSFVFLFSWHYSHFYVSHLRSYQWPRKDVQYGTSKLSTSRRVFRSRILLLSQEDVPCVVILRPYPVFCLKVQSTIVCVIEEANWTTLLLVDPTQELFSLAYLLSWLNWSDVQAHDAWCSSMLTTQWWIEQFLIKRGCKTMLYMCNIDYFVMMPLAVE